ncbi:hypothetical tRNA/rRNA methyltransferase yfiF [EC:2.1.1.-] [Cronobacter dublinensis 582]|nr:hypothetical tRNA/rRNA methyltransferase yfiF [EC:2.1.1.-] [Cronobacter dublinensis 582]
MNDNDEFKGKSGKVKVMYVRSDDNTDKRSSNPRTGKGGGRPAGAGKPEGGRRAARNDRPADRERSRDRRSACEAGSRRYQR